MAELIVHHYPLSFFAEKIRRILAYKRLSWRSVEQPMMMPKPDLTALTGGYRRVPVLQIGADVYCDTAAIARRIEALFPEPRVFPAEHAGVAAIIEDWADHRFTSQIVPSVIVAMMPTLPPGILEDRAAMSPMLSREMFLAAAPHTFTQARRSLDRLERELRKRPFLLGGAFSIADAACFHPVSFLKRSPRLFEEVTRRPALAAWFESIEGFGPADVVPLEAADALAIARDARPADVDGGDPASVPGLAIGDTVTITADDYGREEVCGTVVKLDAEEIACLRTDPILGEVAVHFPLVGYRIVKVSAES